MQIELLPGVAFVFMLIFARVGTMLMLMPALGESSFPARLRLVFALALALVLYPVVGPDYPPVPADFGTILRLLIIEFAIGFLIGLTTRFITFCLQVAGSTIAFQIGLGFAQNVDPTQGIQGALFASFLSMLGIALIFAADLHYLFLGAIRDSYVLFRPGAPLPVRDAALIALETFAGTFKVGVQMAAPFIAFGLIFYLGLGVLSRLMPQIQIFFVAMPANILIGFLLLALVLGSTMAWFLEHVAGSVEPFLLR
ncbi:flagellar biosynthetic protein FliR [Microbaculum sp. FT89]|uniref:flagellar biosynthetic protein FliR n=1 Tax=Microbaculum sp. FT89 TaxID=3447298 RepID=UPI003F535682